MRGISECEGGENTNPVVGGCREKFGKNMEAKCA